MFEQTQDGERVEAVLVGKFGNSGALCECVGDPCGELFAVVVIKVVELAA